MISTTNRTDKVEARQREPAGCWHIRSFLAARPGGTLSIGEGCYFNYGVTLDASVGVALGAQCKVGSMVVLQDDDGEKRLPSSSATGSGLRTALL